MMLRQLAMAALLVLLTSTTSLAQAARARQAADDVHIVESGTRLPHDRFGHHVRGIDEIIALHFPIHDAFYRDSTLSKN